MTDSFDIRNSTFGIRPVPPKGNANFAWVLHFIHHLAPQVGQPSADPFDLLCHLVFHGPMLTLRRHAGRVKKQQATMFNYLRPEEREILDDGSFEFVKSEAANRNDF